MLKSVFLGIQDATSKQNLFRRCLPTNATIDELPLPLDLIVTCLNKDKKVKWALWLNQVL